MNSIYRKEYYKNNKQKYIKRYEEYKRKKETEAPKLKKIRIVGKTHIIEFD